MWIAQYDVAAKAVEAYRKKSPGLFQAGTDFITKSLGFVDMDFRAKHPFSTRTRRAFSEYEHLVQPAYTISDASQGAQGTGSTSQREQERVTWSLRHPTIVAAIIAAIGAVAAALVSSPLLLDLWVSRSDPDSAIVSDATMSSGITAPRDVIAADAESVIYLEVQGIDAFGRLQNALATGLLVSSTGHVITAKHVFSDRDGGQLQISGAVGSRYALSVAMDLLVSDSDADLALLKFRGSKEDYEAVDLCKGVSVDLGADLVTLGFTEDSDLSLLRGGLISKSGPRGLWQTDTAFTSGFAGAPVFDPNGRLLGVVSGRTESGLGVITPIHYANNLLNNVPEPVECCCQGGCSVCWQG